MTEQRIAALDSGGKLHPDVFPATPPLGWGTGGLGTNGGGPQSWDWYFPGTLTVRSGLAMRVVPGSTLAPLSAGTFKPLHLVVTLGTQPSQTSAVYDGRFAANGSTVATFSLGGGPGQWVKGVSLSSLTLIPNDLLSVDITAVGTSTPIQAGDLLVTLWWKWI